MRWQELGNWVRNRRRSADELRQACQELSLETTGSASELRTRLEQHIVAQPQDADAPWSPTQQQPAAPAATQATAHTATRQRRWPWVLLGAVLLLLAIILFAGGALAGIGALEQATPETVVAELAEPTAKVAVAQVTTTKQQLADLAQLSQQQAEAEAANTPNSVCPPAEQLGPWAPSASGEGETFEISAARGWVHASLWWPNGAPRWGNAEISTLLSPGTSITVINGSGTAWDYPPECVKAEVDRQVEVYRTERPRWTDEFHGGVELDELLSLGLVEIRLPLVMAGTTPVASAPTAAPTTTPTATAIATPTATSAPKVDCTATQLPSHQPVVGQTWNLGGSDFVLVHFWTNESGFSQEERKLLLNPGEEIQLSGGGSAWEYPSVCEQTVREEFQKDPMPEVTLDALRAEGLAK